MFFRQPPDFDINGFVHDLESETSIRKLGVVPWFLSAAFAIGFAIVFAEANLGIEHDSWLSAIAGMLLALWAPGVGLYLMHRRYRRLSCPKCLEKMEVKLTDLRQDVAVNDRRTLCPITREIEGRFYGRPSSEGDTRPWVRFMMRIWVCQRCQLFVWSGAVHESDCDEETNDLLTTTYGGPLQELVTLTKYAFELPARIETPPENKEAFLAKFGKPEGRAREASILCRPDEHGCRQSIRYLDGDG